MKAITTLALVLFIASSPLAPRDEIDAFSKSYAHENAGAYDNAIRSFEKVYDAGSYTMNLRIGYLNYLKGDFAQSETYYQQAMSLAPGSVEAMLGSVLPLAAAGKWQEVTDTYQQILRIDPANPTVNYRLALLYTNQKEYAFALPHVQRVTTLYPFNYEAQLLLARLEIARGNIVEARKALKVCLQYNPASSEALEMWELVK